MDSSCKPSADSSDSISTSAAAATDTALVDNVQRFNDSKLEKHYRAAVEQAPVTENLKTEPDVAAESSAQLQVSIFQLFTLWWSAYRIPIVGG